MKKLIRAVRIRARAAIAEKDLVKPCETLELSDFYHERYGRVREYLPSEYRLKEFDLEHPGNFHTFPVWGGYLQNFGDIRRTTDSIDGESKHNWYSLKNFKSGWFYTLEQELFIFVRRENKVSKYRFKM
jgi:hypothetical protein